MKDYYITREIDGVHYVEAQTLTEAIGDLVALQAKYKELKGLAEKAVKAYFDEDEFHGFTALDAVNKLDEELTK